MTTSRGNRTCCYHTNNLYNIRALTDERGNVRERYRYSAYGEPTILDNQGNERSASAVGNAYMFQGRRYDPESRLYYYRHRHYWPELGRFLQRDPTKILQNLYLFVDGVPTQNLDPSGLRALGGKSDLNPDDIVDELKPDPASLAKCAIKATAGNIVTQIVDAVEEIQTCRELKHYCIQHEGPERTGANIELKRLTVKADPNLIRDLTNCLLDEMHLPTIDAGNQDGDLPKIPGLSFYGQGSVDYQCEGKKKIDYQLYALTWVEAKGKGGQKRRILTNVTLVQSAECTKIGVCVCCNDF